MATALIDVTLVNGNFDGLVAMATWIATKRPKAKDMGSNWSQGPRLLGGHLPRVAAAAAIVDGCDAKNEGKKKSSSELLTLLAKHTLSPKLHGWAQALSKRARGELSKTVLFACWVQKFAI